MSSRSRSASGPAAALALVVLAVAFGAFAGASLAAAGGGAGAAGEARFVRPDPETIHHEIDKILDDPRFAQRVSPFKRLKVWLNDLLSELRLGGRTIWIIVIVWGGLALVAVIVHIAYHARLALRKPRHKASGLEFDDFERLKDKPYAELLAIMRRRAAKGRFREAIGVMMLALLRWLDDEELVMFHQSKTNGDYVREYRPSNAGRGEFGRFAVAFDGAVYGRSTCDRRTYDDMNELFEQVRQHAGERS